MFNFAKRPSLENVSRKWTFATNDLCIFCLKKLFFQTVPLCHNSNFGSNPMVCEKANCCQAEIASNPVSKRMSRELSQESKQPNLSEIVYLNSEARKMSENPESSLPERRSIPVPLGDRNSNASNNDNENRIPRPDSKRRRRRRNPFSDGQRNNFPDIDEMFGSMKASASANVSAEADANPFDEVDDDDQHSDIDGSSFLRMSIGARAALNEHARYIAKHGIDGETNHGEAGYNNNSIDETTSEACTNVSLDNQWEKVLDLSRVASSIGGSVDGIPTPPKQGIINLYFESSSGEKSSLEESIEVMTDVSFDFFNSSRVNMLITPERNRNRRAEIVITRDGLGADESLQSHPVGFPSGGEQESFCQNENDIQDSFLRLNLGSPQYSNSNDVQAASFNLGDISRISNNSFSEANYPLDGTRGLRINVDESPQNDDNGLGFASLFGMESPSIILNDSSFLSASGGKVQQKSSPNSKDPILSIEGSSAQKSARSSSSIQSVVSTFITEACNYAEQVALDLEKSVVEGMESLPAEFLQSIDIAESTDAPSPISPVCSSSSPSSSQEASTIKQTPSSLASSTRGHTPLMHLHGRKLHRTVVPRRVYLEESIEVSIGEQSRSIAIQSDPETTRVGRSLLVSFEEAITCKSY